MCNQKAKHIIYICIESVDVLEQYATLSTESEL